MAKKFRTGTFFALLAAAAAALGAILTASAVTANAVKRTRFRDDGGADAYMYIPNKNGHSKAVFITNVTPEKFVINAIKRKL